MMVPVIPWFLPLVLAILIFLIWSEWGSQDCLHRVCNNTTPDISPTDTQREAVDKLLLATEVNGSAVTWRRAMIVAIVATLLILIFWEMTLGGKASGFAFLVVAMFIFVLVYFAYTFAQSNAFPPCEKELFPLR